MNYREGAKNFSRKKIFFSSTRQKIWNLTIESEFNFDVSMILWFLLHKSPWYRSERQKGLGRGEFYVFRLFLMDIICWDGRTCLNRLGYVFGDVCKTRKVSCWVHKRDFLINLYCKSSFKCFTFLLKGFGSTSSISKLVNPSCYMFYEYSLEKLQVRNFCYCELKTKTRENFVSFW